MSHPDPETLQNLVNTELEKVSDWLIANKLSLNISKSNYIIFGENKASDFCVSVSGQCLNQVYETKYLGVIIDHKLNWKEHLKKLHTRIKQNTGILRKVGWFLPRENLISLYFSLNNSHLTYCISSWGSPNTSGLNVINDTVTKCVKYIDCVCPSLNNIKFNPLTIDKLFKSESRKLIHQFLNDNIPSPLLNLFQRFKSDSLVSRKNSKNNVATIHYDQSFHPLRFMHHNFGIKENSTNHQVFHFLLFPLI